MININLKKDAEKVKLLKGIGSKDGRAYEETLAALVGPIVEQVLEQVTTSSLVFKQFTYDFDTEPTIPLDLFEGNEEGLIDIWSLSVAGGLPTNEIRGMSDYRMSTYRLDSAISFKKRYARDARLDVVARGIKRMSEELAVKTEYNSWAVLLAALAGSASYNSTDAHLIDATTADVFQPDDVNRLWTAVKRLRTSWVGGSPSMLPYRGLTDLVVSPEVTAQIRSWSYNPVNTRSIPDTAESTALGLPDSVRTQIWNSAGTTELWGVNFIELLEFGVGRSLNALFDSFYTAAGSEPGFTGASDELALGLDLSTDAFVRVRSTNPDTNSTVTVEVDDQFVRRQEKFGWYTAIEGGEACIDNKAMFGIVI